MLIPPYETDTGGIKLEAFRHCPMLQHAIPKIKSSGCRHKHSATVSNSSRQSENCQVTKIAFKNSLLALSSCLNI